MIEAWGIVVAGGFGSRFGGRKQFEHLGGEPLWEWARRALLNGGVAEVVTVGEMEGGVSPGPRRRDSVLSGLDRVPPNIKYLVVHDAARPLASSQLVERVLSRLGRGDADGVVPAIPVRDAIKQVSGDKVLGSVDRAGLVVVQTPQGFVAEVLRRAHAETDLDAADDAEMVAEVGGSVVTVEGELTNLKVTYPEDLTLLEAIHAG
jgi:2-C-methyl-D-erythritol 4-phosphate cytidylyltransferase